MVYENERERERERKIFHLSPQTRLKKFSFFFFNLNMQEFGSVFELKSLDHVNALHKISHFRKTCAALFFFFFIYCKFD